MSKTKGGVLSRASISHATDRSVHPTLDVLLSLVALLISGVGSLPAQEQGLFSSATTISEAAEAFDTAEIPLDPDDLSDIFEFWGRLGAQQSLPDLLDGLAQHDDEFVRESAARALGHFGDRQAVGPLIGRTLDAAEEVWVREAAILALGRIGGDRAVEFLITFLEAQLAAAPDPSQDSAVLRDAAVSALGIAGDQRALQPLIRALETREEGLVGRAAGALSNLGERGAVPALLTALDESDNSDDRFRLVSALGWLEDRRSLAALIEALREEEPVRGGAGWALRRLSDPEGLRALEQHFSFLPRVALLPFRSRERKPSEDWLGYGLAIDIEGLMHSRPLFDLTLISDPELAAPEEPGALCAVLSQDWGAQQVWLGDFSYRGHLIDVRLRAFEAITARELARTEFSATESELRSKLREALQDLVFQLGRDVDLGEDPLLPETRSFEAWRHYSSARQIESRLDTHEEYGSEVEDLLERKLQEAADAVALDPDFAEARALLGLTLLELGRDEGLTVLQRAVEQRGGSVYVQGSMVDAYLGFEDLTQALHHAERAVRQAPWLTDLTAASLLVQWSWMKEFHAAKVQRDIQAHSSLTWDQSVQFFKNYIFRLRSEVGTKTVEDPEFRRVANQSKALAGRLLQSPTLNLRGPALSVLSWLAPGEMQPILVEALRDPETRAAGVQAYNWDPMGLGEEFGGPSLANLVLDPDPTVSRVALEAIGTNYSSSLTPYPTAYLAAVLQVLGHKYEPALRVAAINALPAAAHRYPEWFVRHVDPLKILAQAAVADTSVEVREAACRTAARYREVPPKAEQGQILLLCLFGVDAEARQEIMAEIGGRLSAINLPIMVPVLLLAMLDEEPSVRWMALRAGSNVMKANPICSGPCESYRQELLVGVTELLEKDPDPLVQHEAALAFLLLSNRHVDDSLIQVAAEEEHSLDPDILETLGQLADPQLVPVFRRALQEQDPDQVIAGCHGLGVLRDSSSSQRLLELLESPEREVRLAATWALGRIRSPLAVSPLLEAIDDVDPWIRAYTFWALGEVGSSRADKVAAVLGRAVAQEDDEDARLLAVHGLAALSNRHARPELLAALTSPHRNIRLHTLFLLAQLMDPLTQTAIMDLVERESDVHVHRAAIRTLGKMGDARIVNPLLNALATGRSSREILKALEQVADETILPKLWEFLLSKPVSAFLVLETMISVGGDSTIPYLIHSLEFEPDIATVAARGLGQVERPSVAVLDALMSCLDTASETDLKIQCAAALAGLGQQNGSEGLIKFLRQPKGRVRESAARALLGHEFPASTAGEIEQAVLDLLASSSSETLEVMVHWLLERQTSQYRALHDFLTSEDQLDNGPQPLERIANYLIVQSQELPGDLVQKMAEGDGLVRLVGAAASVLRGELSGIEVLGERLPLPGGVIEMRYFLARLIEAEVPVPESWHDQLRAQSSGPESAAWLLGGLVGPQSATTLIRSLQGNHLLEAVAASRALLELGLPKAWPALIEFLDQNQILWGDTLGQGLDLGQINTAYHDSLHLGDWKDGRRRLIDMAASKAVKDPELQKGLIKIFRHHGEPFVLASLARNRIFPEGGKKGFLKKPNRVEAGLVYLRGVLAQEEGRQRDQAILAKQALELLGPEQATEVGLALHFLWLEIHAEFHLGNMQRAQKLVENAKKLLPSVSRRDRYEFEADFESITHYWEGRILMALAEPGFETHAEESFRTAVKSLRPEAPSTLWVSKRDVDLKSGIYTYLGMLDRERADEFWEKAEALVRGRLPDGIVALEDRERLYLGLIQKALESNDPESALRYLDTLHLTRRQYFRQSQDIRVGSTEEQGIIDRYQALNRGIQKIENELSLGIDKSQGEATSSGDQDKEKTVLLRSELSQKNRELRGFMTALKREHPQIASLLRNEPIELARVQQILPTDVTLLQYLPLPDQLVIFVIQHDRVEQIEISVTRDRLEELVREYLAGYIEMAIRIGGQGFDQETLLALRGIERIAQPSAGLADAEFGELAHTLYLHLISEVEARGFLTPGDRLGIAPNSFLHYLPFAALRFDAGTAEPGHLIDRYPLFFIHGTSHLWTAHLRKKATDNHNTELWAFSNPQGDLPSAAWEVANIRGKFSKTRLFEGQHAQVSVLEMPSKESRIIHMAMHGILDAGDSTKSYLQMADGPLTVDAIWGLPLTGVQLTTLAACQTGIGEVLSGDDLISLENAFAYAGSASVLATLWPVHSQATAELMTDFYSSLTGGDKIQALAEAQRALKHDEKWAHPFFWAGFTLRGSWE